MQLFQNLQNWQSPLLNRFKKSLVRKQTFTGDRRINPNYIRGKRLLATFFAGQQNYGSLYSDRNIHVPERVNDSETVAFCI